MNHTTTNEPAGIDLDNEHIEKIWNSLDGKRIIAGENQMNWNAALRREFAKAIARDVLARRAPAPVVAHDAPTPREMAIAQAVRRACVQSYSPDDTANDYTEKMGDLDLSSIIRSIDLAPEAAHADDRQDMAREEMLELCRHNPVSASGLPLKAAHAQQEAAPAAPLVEALRQIRYCCAAPAGETMRRIAIAALDAYAAPTTVPDHSESGAANVAAGLRGLAGHIRACETYKLLRGDMEIVDQAIAILSITAGQEAANAKDAARVLYTCKGKGGEYEHIGVAAGAGYTRGGLVHVYRDRSTGNLFYRTPADFDARMERIDRTAMAAVGAAGQEGGE